MIEWHNKFAADFPRDEFPAIEISDGTETYVGTLSGTTRADIDDAIEDFSDDYDMNDEPGGVECSYSVWLMRPTRTGHGGYKQRPDHQGTFLIDS